MNEALREQYEALGLLFVRSTSKSARRGYEAGARVRTVMLNPRAYGVRAVLELARALGKKPGVLYDAAKVAAVWSEEEFLALLELPNRFRQPLSFSHFVLLAEAGERRDELLQQALSEGWSVRELRQHVLVAQAAPQTSALDRARLMTRQLSHLADTVEQVFLLLPELELEVATEELANLRALRARMAVAFARLDSLPAVPAASPSPGAWGDTGPSAEG